MIFKYINLIWLIHQKVTSNIYHYVILNLEVPFIPFPTKFDFINSIFFASYGSLGKNKLQILA